MKYLLTGLASLLWTMSFSQTAFTEATLDLAYAFITSASPMAVADMNNDGLDDIVRLHRTQQLFIDYQLPSGQFEGVYTGVDQIFDNWSMCIGDADNNGLNDVLLGSGNDEPHLVKNIDGENFELVNLGGPPILAQCSNMIDINQNGWLDLFVTNDNGINSVYRNDEKGNFTYDTLLMYTPSNTLSDNSGNYASIWTDIDNDRDLDLYISKCRGGVLNPNDPRRINLLFVNNGDNTFTEDAQARGLVPFAQTWATDFADIDNDGDLDAFMINHDTTSRLYENDGTGHFTDITAGAGFSPAIDNIGLALQVKFEDFDADGFVDLILTSSQSGYRYFRNNGNKTFTVIFGAFQTQTQTMHSFALGDLNNDGFMDVMGGFGRFLNANTDNTDRLFLNDGNNNNWCKVRLEGTNSNRSGIGARLELHGAWGKMIREVRSGESYSINNSLTKHFGLGNFTSIDSLNIFWPSGQVDHIVNPNINEQLFIVEGGCIPTNGTIVDEICQGDTLIVNETPYFNTGIYSQDLVNAEGCDSTLIIDLLVNPSYVINLTSVACYGDVVAMPDGSTQVVTEDFQLTISDLTDKSCDSITTLFVEVLDVYDTIIEHADCAGYDWIFPDLSTHYITHDTVQISYLQSVEGCDSIVRSELKALDEFNEINPAQVCYGESYVFPDGTTFVNIVGNISHTSHFQTVDGCDSTVLVNLMVQDTFASDTLVQLCQGDVYVFPDGTEQVIQSDMQQTSILSAITGCDSTILTDIRVRPSYQFTLSENICEGNNYTFFNGTTAVITKDTNHFTYFTTNEGCDSTLVESLTVLDTFVSNESVVVCSGDSFVFPDGSTINNILAPLIYDSKLQAINGCDSTVSTLVNVSETYDDTFLFDLCSGESIVLGEIVIENIEEDSSYVYDFETSNGCDSTLQIDVLVSSINEEVILSESMLTATENEASISWLWCDDGFSVIEGENEQSFTPSLSGNYAALIDNGVCSFQSECFLVMVSSTLDPVFEGLSTYPNPVNQVLNINWVNAPGKASYQILDLHGKVVESIQNNEKSISIDMSDKEAAVYILKVELKNKTYSQKIIKTY